MYIGDETVVKAVVASLRQRHSVAVKLWGHSMLPTVWPGARLRFRLCGVDDVRSGDVVLLVHGSNIVAHRVIQETDGELYSQGDAYNASELRVRDADLVARAEGIPLGRWTLPLPDIASNLFQKSYVRVLPGVRAAYLAGRRRASSIWKKAQRERRLRGMRKTGLSCRFVVAGRQDLPAIRVYLLRRGIRPTAALLEAWVGDVPAGSFTVLALWRNQIVGSTRVVPLPERRSAVHCWDVWVRRRYRGLGIGKGLVDHAIGEARVRGFQEVEGRSRPQNVAMYRAARGLGFVDAGETRTTGEGPFVYQRFTLG